MNIADYGTASRGDLRAEYVRIVDFLAAHHVLLAGATADRERRYWKVYDECDPSSTVAARDKMAASAALPSALEVIEIKAEIEGFKVQIDLIKYLLT